MKVVSESRRRSIARLRLGVLSLVDVGMTSAGAMLLTVIAARSMTVREFGIFGVLLAISAAAQSITQGALGDVLLQRAGEQLGRAVWRIERWSLVAILSAMLACALVLAPSTHVLGLLLGSISVSILIARSGWVRPFLYTHASKVESACLSGFFLLAALTAFALSIMLAKADGWLFVVSAFTVVYGVHGLVSYFTVLSRSQRMAGSRRKHLWNWPYAGEALVLVVVPQLAGLAIIPALGLEFSAGLRGATLMFGPVILGFSSYRLLALPFFAPRRDSLTLVVAALASMVLGVTIWGLISLAVLHISDGRLLGDSTSATEQLLAWVFLSFMGQGLYLVMFVASRAWALDRQVRLGRAVLLIATVVGAVLAIITSSPDPYFVGPFVGCSIACTVMWHGIWHLRRGASPGNHGANVAD